MLEVMIQVAECPVLYFGRFDDHTIGSRHTFKAVQLIKGLLNQVTFLAHGSHQILQLGAGIRTTDLVEVVSFTEVHIYSNIRSIIDDVNSQDIVAHGELINTLGPGLSFEVVAAVASFQPD